MVKLEGGVGRENSIKEENVNVVGVIKRHANCRLSKYVAEMTCSESAFSLVLLATDAGIEHDRFSK